MVIHFWSSWWFTWLARTRCTIQFTVLRVWVPWHGIIANTTETIKDYHRSQTTFFCANLPNNCEQPESELIQQSRHGTCAQSPSQNMSANLTPKWRVWHSALQLRLWLVTASLTSKNTRKASLSIFSSSRNWENRRLGRTLSMPGFDSVPQCDDDISESSEFQEMQLLESESSSSSDNCTLPTALGSSNKPHCKRCWWNRNWISESPPWWLQKPH